MLGDLAVVGTGNFWSLMGQQLDCLVPLAGDYRSLDGLLDLLSLDVVVDSGLSLLDRHQVVAPPFL